MKIVVWDTETTGLPVNGWTLEQQPYIIQFAGILGNIDKNGKFTEEMRKNILVKPPISIPFSSSQVHGIYDRDVAEKPAISEEIDTIIRFLNSAEMVVGHNIEYDEQVLRYELERLGKKGEYTPLGSICTMRSATEYCKLPGRGFAYKPPKLAELHRFLFDEWFEGAHDAMIDVEATLRSFTELVKKKVVPIEESDIMRLF